jgi:hypothetical protein
MARVTNRESYATQNHSEILSQAKLSAQEKTSNTQESSELQEVVLNPEEIKSAKDYANAIKSDGQLQATLLKGQLHDTASRLDQFREGDLKGLEKDAKKFGIEDLGVIKDNLGKDIVKKEGPGIEDMYKKGKKYELPDRDPLKDTPKTLKQEKDAKKGPDTPFKDDPGLVSVDQATKDGLKALFGPGGGSGGSGPSADKQLMEKQADLAGPKAQELVKELDKAGVFDAMQKAKEKKYSDPDQVDSTKVEKPKDPPPNSKDLLGHKVNPLHNDPIIDTENVDIKKVVAENKKAPKKTEIYTDPDQMQKKAKFDAANPPRIEENELKNTGNPNDFNGVQWELPKGGGDKPHTDGEGGDEQQPQTIKTATGTTGGNSGNKVQLPFGNPNPAGDEDDDDVGPNVPH